MVQKKLPTINSAHGSETRNIINELIKLFNGMGYTYNEALQKAHDILNEANRINRTNNNTNERLDRIIADSGTSSTEVVDARGPFNVLNSRLTEHEKGIDYLNYRPVLSDGQITLPNDFKITQIDVQRVSKFNYKHSYTPYNMHDWKNAKEVYVSSLAVSSDLGYDFKQPISLGRVRSNLNAGLYGTNDLIINFLENVYNRSNAISQTTFNNNVLFRSASNSGQTWLGILKRENNERTRWINFEGIFSTELIVLEGYGIPKIKGVVNVHNTDSFGMPYAYVEVSTLAECKSKEGTFYTNDKTVYCNNFKRDNIHDLDPYEDRALMDIDNNGKTIMFENVNFIGDVHRFHGLDIYSKFRFFNSRFYRGMNDAFSMIGRFDLMLFDCVSAYASKDGFNYHTGDSRSVAVEINCKAYFNGSKYRYIDGNNNRESNNGSTAHDGMYMLRIGGKYWGNQGPSVADVNDCYSISIGVKVGNNQTGNTGLKSGFWLQGENNPKIVMEAEVTGSEFNTSIYSDEPSSVRLMDITGTPISPETEVGALWLEGDFNG